MSIAAPRTLAAPRVTAATPVLRAHDVITCESADCVVLLALASERYFVLNGLAGDVWATMRGPSSRASVISQIQAMYPSVSAERVEKDVDDAIAQFLHQRLIVLSDQQPQAPRLRASLEEAHVPSEPLSFVVAFASLFACHLSLRVLGLKRTLRLILGRKILSDTQNGEAAAKSLCIGLHNATRFFPFRVECLERSVCGLWLLRRRGIQAELRVGVVARPFQAHAWIDLHGIPVNDDPDNLTLYRPFESITLEAVTP